MKQLIQTIRQWLSGSTAPEQPTTTVQVQQPPPTSTTQIQSEGGAVVEGDVTIKQGNFIGRDYIVYPPKPSPTPPATAPAPPPDFVGRTAELDELTQALSSGQSAAITALQGMGGIGKTVLAQYLVEQLNKQQPVLFPGGIF